MKMFFLKCDVPVPQSVSMHVTCECLHVISIGKSLFSQSSKEWRRKRKAVFIQIQLQLERRRGGGGGGVERRRRRRRRRRCNLSEGLQGVLAEHDCRLGACTCVCVCTVTSPREFRAKQHQRRRFSNRTGAGNKERLQVNIKPPPV